MEEAWQALDSVASPEKPWAAALRDGTAVLLGMLAERPAFAHVALVDAPLAGGRAAVLRESAKAALLDFLDRGRNQAEPDIPASAARGALAGAEALVVRQILASGTEQLRGLAPDVAYMLAVPFLGVAEARHLGAGLIKRPALRAVA